MLAYPSLEWDDYLPKMVDSDIVDETRANCN